MPFEPTIVLADIVEKDAYGERSAGRPNRRSTRCTIAPSRSGVAASCASAGTRSIPVPCLPDRMSGSGR